jgi:hypothetical protein
VQEVCSPYSLQLAPSNAACAACVVALLHHLQWHCFSVIYHQDTNMCSDMWE